MVTKTYNLRTTASDSVDDFLRVTQRHPLKETKPEGKNPSIGCGFSKMSEMPELEQHAPATVTDPFTSSFSVKELDNANPSLVKS
jgi:hypothetical protein